MLSVFYRNGANFILRVTRYQRDFCVRNPYFWLSDTTGEYESDERRRPSVLYQT